MTRLSLPCIQHLGEFQWTILKERRVTTCVDSRDILLTPPPSVDHLNPQTWRVSAADKGWRVYPLGPRTDVVASYSGCTPGKRRAWYLPDDQHTTSLVGLRGGWRHARTKFFFALMDPMLLCPETETRSLTTPDEFNALLTETLPESVPTTSNSEHSNAPEIPQPKKSAPTEYVTDEEDITYDVEEEELEPDPTDKFTIKEDPLNFPKRYLRALTPSRYRKSRG
ncbi:hypothetical protein TNCV_1357851 [Trichonephila clavipes]|uniref:Uncharacterized protein n=1 Tax=Trichonephila clavipes TaxID=2585209 RepID=A0A8X6VIC0_TRICX|nr:hypothetical protein TNCV_1357851 [Trichonephila clavipes]